MMVTDRHDLRSALIAEGLDCEYDPRGADILVPVQGARALLHVLVVARLASESLEFASGPEFYVKLLKSLLEGLRSTYTPTDTDMKELAR